MGLLQRLFGRRRRPGPPPPPPPRRRSGRLPGPPPDDAAGWIEQLLARATETAPHLDEQLVARVAARISARAGEIPPVAAFPGTARRILKVGDAADGDVNPLVRAVSQDAAVTAAVLTVANSAASAPASPIIAVRDAVLRLGGAESRRIAVGVAMRAMFREVSDGGGATLQTRFFADSLGDAFTADWLARTLRHRDADRAFVVAMVRELARPAALALLNVCLRPEEVDELDDHHAVAICDEAAPRLARAVALQLELPDGLDEGLLAATAGATPVVHMARLASALGALLRHAPRPSWWAAQAQASAAHLALTPATARALITQRGDDERLALEIAGVRARSSPAAAERTVRIDTLRT